MDYDLTATVPSALAATATGLGYTTDAVTLMLLAQYIRNLGYRAYASMNDSALSVPLAIQAGLGELGRHSMVITPEFGPRVRFGKVFTDMPLNPDIAAEVRCQRVLRYLSGVRRGVSAACNSVRRALGRATQQVELFAYPQVDDRRREVLQLLGKPKHGVLNLHSGVPL